MKRMAFENPMMVSKSNKKKAQCLNMICWLQKPKIMVSKPKRKLKMLVSKPKRKAQNAGFKAE